MMRRQHITHHCCLITSHTWSGMMGWWYDGVRKCWFLNNRCFLQNGDTSVEIIPGISACPLFMLAKHTNFVYYKPKYILLVLIPVKTMMKKKSKSILSMVNTAQTSTIEVPWWLQYISIPQARHDVLLLYFLIMEFEKPLKLSLIGPEPKLVAIHRATLTTMA